MLEQQGTSPPSQPKSTSYAAFSLFKHKKSSTSIDQQSSSLSASDALMSEKEINQTVLADGAIAIPYCIAKGANEFNSVNIRIMKNRAQKLTFFSHNISAPLQQMASPREIPYAGLTLIKESEGDNKYIWKLYDVVTGLSYQPDAHTTYTFVVMPDKTIRVANAVKGGHLILSNYALYIRYAGEIKFDDKGEIGTWNNHSGSYCPPAELATQAGIEENLTRFIPVNRNSESDDYAVKSYNNTL